MKVYIENTSESYEKMFSSRGWDLVDSIEASDLVTFTGGPDINPVMYGKEGLEHPETYYDKDRDNSCNILYDKARLLQKPMVGICRGAQFLHIKAGGTLIQHCNNHRYSPLGHLATYLWDTENFYNLRVSSTHHQMMHNHEVGELLMYSKEATIKETMHYVTDDRKVTYIHRLPNLFDIEAMYYPQINAVSFQPHPEHEDFTECTDSFFSIINNILLKGLIL